MYWHQWHSNATWIWPVIWLSVIFLIVGSWAWWRPWRTRGYWYRQRGRQYNDPTRVEALLAERFARGEIDEEEYRTRLRVLRSELATEEDLYR